MENLKAFFKKIHTEKFKWYDEIIILMIFTAFFMQIVASIISSIMIIPFRGLIQGDETGYWDIFFEYISFLGIWIVFLLIMALIKRNRPILKAIWTAPKGNNIKFLGIGLLIGFGMNMFCAIVAILHKDIAIYYSSFDFIKLFILFIAVFVQSSAEELICRGFLYQSLRRSYRHPAVAIIGNSLFFSIMHIFNPGISLLALINIAVVGILFSLMVYYMDSIWCAMAAHAAWNYTQNIILGLPNSGLVTPVSIFKLDAAAANDSFCYSVDFGIEGTILAVLVLSLTSLIIYFLYRGKNVASYDPWNQE